MFTISLSVSLIYSNSNIFINNTGSFCGFKKR